MIKNTDSNLYIKNSTDDYLVWNPQKDARALNIELSENTNSKIVYIMDSVCDTNLQIHLKKNSSLDLIILGTSKENLDLSKTIDTIIEENAYLNSKKLYCFNSNVNLVSKTFLQGKKASNDDYQVILGCTKQLQKYMFEVTHNEKETFSTLQNYAICKNDSKINIDTNGIIINGSKESNLNQKTKGILLSKDSEISANPWLQIDEYDCLASHGAGIGAIDEEDLFYLMSRGLSRIESEKLLISGFVNPVLEALADKEKEIALNLIQLL